MRAIAFFLLLLVSTSCTNNNIAEPSRKLIADLLIKYPQLGLDYKNEKTSFTLVRSIKDEDWQIELELYTAIKSGLQIIIINNNYGSYALPMLDAYQSDYWQMDSLHQKNIPQKVNTSFEQELRTATKKLHLDSEFFFARHLFEHLLLLRESYYPDPCSDSTELPAKAMYEGKYIFIMTLHKTKSDSISLETMIPGRM